MFETQTPFETLQGEAKLKWLVSLHQNKAWPFTIVERGQSVSKGMITFAGRYKYRYNKDTEAVKLTGKELNLVKKAKEEGLNFWEALSTEQQLAEMRHTPASIKWAWKNIKTHKPKAGKGSIGLNTKPGADIVQIDIKAAYTHAAAARGIISQKTYKALCQKTTKNARLIALGSLATKTKVKKGVYTPYTLVKHQGLEIPKEHFLASRQGLRHNATRPPLPYLKALRKICAEKADAKSNLFARSAQLCAIPVYTPLQRSIYAAFFAQLEEVEAKKYEIIEEPPTRPASAPLFFSVANEIAELCYSILQEVESSYFYWFDAIFCPRSAVGHVTALIEAAGFEYKETAHSSIQLKNGVIYVDEKAYPVSDRFTEEGHAKINALYAHIAKNIERISIEEIAAKASENQMRLGEVDRTLRRFGMELPDVFDIIHSTELKGFYSALEGCEDGTTSRQLSKTEALRFLENNKQRFFEQIIIEKLEADEQGGHLETYSIGQSRLFSLEDIFEQREADREKPNF